MDELIKITVKEFRMLKHAEAMLDALEERGVDNWDWYGEALSALYDEDAVNAEVDSRIAK